MFSWFYRRQPLKYYLLLVKDCKSLHFNSLFGEIRRNKTHLYYYNSTIIACVAESESRFRSAVTPSVCPSVRHKILSSQLLWNYWTNYHETWYVDRTSYVVMHIGRKFWASHFCGSYALWNLENTHKWPCHRNSSETTDPIFMKLGM